MTDQLISNLVLPTGNAALAAGPLAQQPNAQQNPAPAGAPATGREMFANAMRAQLPHAQQPVDAQSGVTEAAAAMPQRRIFSARASPDISALGALSTAPELTELSATVASPPGKILPPVGNVLPDLELTPAADERPLPAQVTDDLLHGGIIVPAAAPDPALTAAVAGSRAEILTMDTRPASPIWNAATATTTGDTSASASLPDHTVSMNTPTGGQSADADSSSQNQSYRAMESMLMNNPSTDNAPVSQRPKFVLGSDSAVTPASYTISSTAGQGALSELMELPQMQSMRPLQPTADPELFSSGLGQRIMLMSQDGVQSARLKLHPEHLGPLDVRIRVEDDSVRVWFGAQHGQTRDALEAAIPRLRELFADQGLQLVRADVTSGEGRAQTDDGSAYRADLESAPSNQGPTGLTDSFIPSRGRVSDRLVDIYV